MKHQNLNYSLVSNAKGWYAIYDASTDFTTGFGSLLTTIEDLTLNGRNSFILHNMWSTIYRYDQYSLTNDINEISLSFIKNKYPELFI